MNPPATEPWTGSLTESTAKATGPQGLTVNQLHDGQSFDDPRSYRLSGDNYVQGMNNFGFLEATYNRVNGFVIFDSLLAQYGHFGTVYVECVLDYRGLLMPESIRAKSTDEILKVHSLRVLRFALSAPLTENDWLHSGQTMRLRLRFQYQQDGSNFDDTPEKIAGLALTIRRKTGERPIAKTLTKHLFGGGGINGNPFVMYERWEKYLKAPERHRFSADPFADYRADPDFSG